MVSFNRLYLIGNLARDPEIRYTPQGKAVCELVVAVDAPSRAEGEKSASFFPVTVWEKQAEACAKHLRKGAPVHVEGRLNQERWEQDGESRSRITVTAHSVQFLGPKAKVEGVESVVVPAGASEEPEGPEADVPF